MRLPRTVSATWVAPECPGPSETVADRPWICTAIATGAAEAVSA